jgi:hypothetical protein
MYSWVASLALFGDFQMGSKAISVDDNHACLDFGIDYNYIFLTFKLNNYYFIGRNEQVTL